MFDCFVAHTRKLRGWLRHSPPPAHKWCREVVGASLKVGENVSDMTRPKAPTWDEWVEQISGGATQTEIGRRMGVSRSTVARWSKRVSADTVLALARTYDAGVLEGLTVAGLLHQSDFTPDCEESMLKRTSTSALIHELCSRYPAKKPPKGSSSRGG